MNINSTLFLQAIVFAILVWFTMKYVWPPITKALDERAAKIADGLAAADKAKSELANANKRVEQELATSRNETQQRIQDAERRAAAIVEEAKGKANDEAAKITAPLASPGIDHCEIDVFPVNDRAADPRAGEVDVTQFLAIQREGEKLVGRTRSDEQAGVLWIPSIKGDAMDAIEAFVFVTPLDLTGRRVMGEPLAAVSVRDIKIPVVRIDGGFGRAKLRFLGVIPGLFRPSDGHQFLAAHVELHDDAALGIGEPEKLGAVFIGERKPVCSGV